MAVRSGGAGLASPVAAPTLRAGSTLHVPAMPIYAFQCAACGHAFDRLQKLSDADPTACPACSAEAVSRKLTAPQFRLAGGGWYETDFKGDGDKKRNLAGDGGGEAKPADAKPDAAAKPTPAAATAKPAVPSSTPAPASPPKATD